MRKVTERSSICSRMHSYNVIEAVFEFGQFDFRVYALNNNTGLSPSRNKDGTML